ncbi:signal peptidase I [Streptomyces tsukubensis]|uniref:Signal peptidase I n=1 Tax=Streptomyces tsukubensis TaxID=83656 RepID=A0A1V4A5C6_9ACTN|nr:signal peptidase I [Streptomyces tsukubensis]
MGSRRRDRVQRSGGGASSAHAASPGDVDAPAGRSASRGAVRPGRADRRRLARKVKRRRRRSAIKEIPLLIGVAVLMALVLKTFLVQAFVIPSGSMEQTIKIGDRVLVDKLTPWFGSRPQRGDVVVFKDPGHWLGEEGNGQKEDPVGVKQLKGGLTFIGLLPSADEQDLIKRVVAVGGDTVKCCDAKGRVSVNGTSLDEPYLHPGNKPSSVPFEVRVPAHRLFVMGDHRANSGDSRFHRDGGFDGTVSEDGVVGRAVVIGWPFGHWHKLEERDTYRSVPDVHDGAASGSGRSHKVATQDLSGMIPLPTPAELPLVMGVVGLPRRRGRRLREVRSGCGGCGGRRTVRARRAGGARTRRQGPRGLFGWFPRRGRPGGRAGQRGRWRTRPRQTDQGQEAAAFLLEGTAPPGRHRPGACPGDQDVPGAGVLDSFRVHGEHPPGR